jgi:hypothetical protein
MNGLNYNKLGFGWKFIALNPTYELKMEKI